MPRLPGDKDLLPAGWACARLFAHQQQDVQRCTCHCSATLVCGNKSSWRGRWGDVQDMAQRILVWWQALGIHWPNARSSQRTCPQAPCTARLATAKPTEARLRIGDAPVTSCKSLAQGRPQKEKASKSIASILFIKFVFVCFIVCICICRRTLVSLVRKTNKKVRAKKNRVASA